MEFGDLKGSPVSFANCSSFLFMKKVYHRKYRYSMLPTLSSSEVSEVTAPKLWQVAEHVRSPGSAELLGSSVHLCELDLNQTMGMLIELSCSCNYVESNRDQIEERQGHFPSPC